MASLIKYIAIVAVIIYGLKSSQFISDKMFNQYGDSSVIPVLMDIGGKLLNQDVNIANSEVNATSKDINLSNFNLR